MVMSLWPRFLDHPVDEGRCRRPSLYRWVRGRFWLGVYLYCFDILCSWSLQASKAWVLARALLGSQPTLLQGDPGHWRWPRMPPLGVIDWSGNRSGAGLASGERERSVQREVAERERNRERKCADTIGTVCRPFRLLKYKDIFQIKYTEAVLSNSTRKLLWFEVSKMLITV